MIKIAASPYGKSGVIGGSMLGLGRALGETMAVAIVLLGGAGATLNLISSSNPSTIASNIALKSSRPPAWASTRSSPAAWCCSAITLAVNMIARADRGPARRLLRSQLMSIDTQTAPAVVQQQPLRVPPRAWLRSASTWPASPSSGAVGRHRLQRHLDRDLRRHLRHRGLHRHEGRRGPPQAADRLMTCLVTTAFAIAMVPLVSLVYTVLDNGSARLDSAFFTNSMFRVVGEGGAPTTPSSAR